MQMISSSSRRYPILFQSWLVSGSSIDLTTSFDWGERWFRILDTRGNFKRVRVDIFITKPVRP